MRLTTYTDYALRVLIHVGLKDGELVRIADIATAFGVSRNHLTKVVHNLGVFGYLRTVQGRNGGLRLAQPADRIAVGMLVRAFEPDFRLVECFDPESSQCCIESVCVLNRELQGATDAFLERLDQVTLADLLHPRRNLQSLLGLSAGNVSISR